MSKRQTRVAHQGLEAEWVVQAVISTPPWLKGNTHSVQPPGSIALFRHGYLPYQSFSGIDRANGIMAWHHGMDEGT